MGKQRQRHVQTTVLHILLLFASYKLPPHVRRRLSGDAIQCCGGKEEEQETQRVEEGGGGGWKRS